MTVTIRPAEPTDASALAALKLRLFRDTFLEGGFAIPYPPQDLARFEAQTYSEDSVAAELTDPEHATWIAEADHDMLGYAHVGPCKLPHPEVRAGAGELYQLYLARDAQGTGTGGRLLDLVLDHLGKTRPGPVWLGAWSGNLRAHAVYVRRGFRKVGEYRFSVGSWQDEEFIFRRD